MEEEINQQKSKYQILRKFRRWIIGTKLEAFRESIKKQETKLSTKVKAYFIMLNFIFLCYTSSFTYVLCADFQKVRSFITINLSQFNIYFRID